MKDCYEKMKDCELMIIGMGDLGCKILDILIHECELRNVIISGRNEERLLRKANHTMFVSEQFDKYPTIIPQKLDLNNIEKTAEIIYKVKPKIILNTTSLQSWRILTYLPSNVFNTIDQAQFGPWLPMHLTLSYKLMKAVKLSNIDVNVVNASFPDAVNSILSKVDLQPTIGIGNVANLIPALKTAVSHLTQKATSSIKIYFVGAHFTSHFIPRFGYIDNLPYAIKIYEGKKDITNLINIKKLFNILKSKLRRLGGTEGQSLTAASACKVLIGMINDSKAFAHAPGPNGLPGGYPVVADSNGGTVTLPQHSNLTLNSAIEINENGLLADGIEKIEKDGTVIFADKEMEILNKHIGYTKQKMKIDESEDCAKELRSKFVEFVKKHDYFHL